MPIFSASKLVTVDRHIVEEEEMHPEATGAFTSLLHDLTFAMRIIAREVRSAGLNDILGITEDINVHGEKVRKLDKYANEVIFRALDHSGHLCAMVSEEAEDIIYIPKKFKKGNYVLVFDPLDGSTNIDVNITIGTIFSIYRRLKPNSGEDGTLEDVLQPGNRQVAAGYVLYGSSTILVYTTGNGVNIFTYDPSIGEFLLTYEKIKMPYRGIYYSCNEGNYNRWDARVKRYVDYLKTPSSDGTRPYSLRYIAAAVADIHRTLHYGGIYMYPADSLMPEGKIRLVYEANALAYIIEQAGGIATNGEMRLLDIKPKSIHQRIPFFVGSPYDMLELDAFLKGLK